MTLQIGFLASYNGSSMRAIVGAMKDKRLNAKPALVISNNPNSPALAFAEEEDISYKCLNAKRCGGDEAVDKAIMDEMLARHVDLVVLSGYMKRIGPQTLSAFKGRILNIHPSLLPAFGGPGMYGMHVHFAVIEAGVKESGATVHIVDDEYDSGDMIAQVKVPVLAGDSPETLQARIAQEEGELYIRAIQQFLTEGDLAGKRQN